MGKRLIEDERDARAAKAAAKKANAQQEYVHEVGSAVALLSSMFYRGSIMGVRLREIRVYLKQDGTRDLGMVMKGTTAEGRVVTFSQSSNLADGLVAVSKRATASALKWVPDKYQEKVVEEPHGEDEQLPLPFESQ